MDKSRKLSSFSSSIENTELLGHQNAEKLFLNLINNESLPHGWIFSGPKGIGKATLAHKVARYLLCYGLKKESANPSEKRKEIKKGENLWVNPESEIFQRVSAGGHADLLTVERKPNERGKWSNNIPIDDIRKIKSFFSKTAAEDGWRIVIIDSADEMTSNAANALLKNLEEPPSHTLLLLISHNPNSLLSTIRSRCRELTLSILKYPDIINLLGIRFPNLTDLEKNLLAIIGEGRIGYTIKLNEIGGLEIYSDIMQLLNSMPKLTSKKLHDFATKLAKPGAEDIFLNSMNILNGILARLIRGHIMDIEKVPIAEIELQKNFFNDGNLDRWLNVWENINNYQYNHKILNLDPKQTTLNIFLEIEQNFSP